jgi:hypothetical protein
MPKPTNKLTGMPRPTTSVFSAQHIADVLALVCCAAVNDRASRLHPLLAVAGALSAPIALASLPVLLLGAASRTALCIVFAHLIAAALRWKALNMDEESAHPLDRPEAGLSGYVAAFTFVPEAVYRWAELRGAPWSVEVWHGTDGSSLHVGALPSPRHVRQLASAVASAHAYGAGPRVVVLNACRWWGGWTDAYSDLGIEQMRQPAASTDVLESVGALKRLLRSPAGGARSAGAGAAGADATAADVDAEPTPPPSTTRPVRVYLHCESGAYAACVAEKFTCESDQRLKENVVPIDGAHEKVGAMRGVYYDWIDKAKGSARQIGVIAQEVQAACPELVDASDAYLTVDYARIAAVLIEAVKDLTARNAALDARVAALEKAA